MRIIDRKALLAALIMANANGVLASGMDDPFGGLAGGAGAPVAPTVASGGHEDMETVASVVACAPVLEPIRDRLNKFTASELKRIKSFFELHPCDACYSFARESVEALPHDKKEPVCGYVAKFFTEELNPENQSKTTGNLLAYIKDIDADEIIARAQAIETHAESLIPEEVTPDQDNNFQRTRLFRAEALGQLMRLKVDQINAIGENPIILFKRMGKSTTRGFINKIMTLTQEEIKALAVKLQSQSIMTPQGQIKYICNPARDVPSASAVTIGSGEIPEDRVFMEGVLTQLERLGLDKEQVELVSQFERQLRHVAGCSVDTLSEDQIRLEEQRAEDVTGYLKNSSLTDRAIVSMQSMFNGIGYEDDTLVKGIRLMADKDAYERATAAQKKAAFLMLTNRIALKRESMLKAQIIASFIIMNFPESTDDDRLRAVARLKDGMLNKYVMIKNKLLCASIIMRHPKVKDVQKKQSAAFFILENTPVREMNDNKAHALLVMRHKFGDTSFTEEEKGIINEMMPPVPGSEAGGGSMGAASAATPVDAAPAGAGGPGGASGAAVVVPVVESTVGEEAPAVAGSDGEGGGASAGAGAGGGSGLDSSAGMPSDATLARRFEDPTPPVAPSSGIVTAADIELLSQRMGRTGPLCEDDYCTALAISYRKDSLLTSAIGKVLTENKNKGLLTEEFIAKARKILENKPGHKGDWKILRALFRAEEKGVLTDIAVDTLMISLANKEVFLQKIKNYYAKKPEGGARGGK